MGECGCVSNDQKFTFPAPGKSFYVLTLSGACENCDTPSGITLERIDPDNVLYANYKRGEFIDGPLKFEQWPDSLGVAIVTGKRRGEFIKALLSYLVGVSSDEMGENGAIDESGAEVILEEMYYDACQTPTVVTPVG